MTIGIIDVGIGNIGSLRGALSSQGWDTRTVDSSGGMAGLTHLFLPGVGSFCSAMHRLHAARLVDPILRYAADGGPIMGICLGMQLLADIGVEGGRSVGLGLISGNVIPLENRPDFRLPHVGWNMMHLRQSHPLLKGIRQDVDFYFVHSHFFSATREVDIVGATEYGLTFPSFVAKGKVVGVQFHPEKSQRNGLRLLDNFCLWDGTC
jgi:imidazole glycerol-phosphate synthase subunit HisH